MANSNKGNPSEFIDYYKLLGIPFGADRDTIKHSFRQLAKKFHPDNPYSGSKEQFQTLLDGYKTLMEERLRFHYDQLYINQKLDFHIEESIQSPPTQNTPVDSVKELRKVIPPKRVLYVHSLVEFAKRGLMRKGLRMKDRKKYTGNMHDFEILIFESEKNLPLKAFIPQIVRVLCPECKGSDIHCEACNGKGSYKSFRNIPIDIIPGKWKSGQVWEVNLQSLRRERFTYFKKKTIKVLLKVIPG